MNRLRRLRRIDAMYAELPRLDCQGKCQESCGPIFMSELEWERITDQLGTVPEGDASLVCPMLTEDGRCSVYAIRPMICRLWGLVERMRCPHGCEPERWLTDAEAGEFLLAAWETGARSGSRHPDAVQGTAAGSLMSYTADVLAGVGKAGTHDDRHERSP